MLRPVVRNCPWRESIVRAYRTLGPDFKHYLFTAGLFSLAYFSFGFLLLNAYSVGFAIRSVTLLYALYNVSFVLAAPLLGKLGDHIGRRKIIALEYILYLLMCVGFIFASAKWQVVALFLVFGVCYAIDESQSNAYITDMEKAKRGTAIGAYSFFTGRLSSSVDCRRAVEAQPELRLRLRRDHVRSGLRVLHLAQSQNSQRSVLSKRTDRLGNVSLIR